MFPPVRCTIILDHISVRFRSEILESILDQKFFNHSFSFWTISTCSLKSSISSSFDFTSASIAFNLLFSSDNSGDRSFFFFRALFSLFVFQNCSKYFKLFRIGPRPIRTADRTGQLGPWTQSDWSDFGPWISLDCSTILGRLRKNDEITEIFYRIICEQFPGQVVSVIFQRFWSVRRSQSCIP